MRYSSAGITLETARNVESGKPLQNNTRLFARGSDYAIRLHETDVVTIHNNGTYTLNTGGWQTVTTKERINSYAPVSLWQKNGLWYLSADGQTYNFTDGMTVDMDGKPIDANPIDGTLEKRKRQLDRKVAKYVKGYLAHIQKNGLESPGPGDCCGCLFAISCKPKVERGKEMMGFDHYLSHFDEEYYVPSLLWRAVVEQGFRDPGLIWAMIEADCEKGQESWQARNALTRFLGRRKVAMMEETA